jgi:cytochrome c oxidase assembly protein subunit 15
MIALHRYAVLVACATVVLLTAGGLVTSTGSGLSVPDWPTTYGWNMFTFPLSKMVGGIRYEHSHRLIASTVGFLTIGLALWIWRVDSRRWMRWLGVVALAAVITQGILGGITVLYFLPAPVSIAHAGLAQLFFLMTVSVALFTSRGWRQRSNTCPNDSTLATLAVVTTIVIYAQVLVGATMRHMGAGLAIPDFPLAFGRLVPAVWNTGIAVHYAHRVGALVVAVLVLATTAHVLYHHKSDRWLRTPGLVACLLLMVQITLGALTVLSGRDVATNTAHLVTGALLLASSLVLALRSLRRRFVDATVALSSRPATTLLDPRSSLGVRA